MRRVRVPHVYVILFALLVLAAVAGLFVPAGGYERDDAGRVLAGTFAFDEEVLRPRGWALAFGVLTAPLRGIVDASAIVAFILVIGGAFKVIERSGAFEAAIRWTVARLGGREILLVPASMLLFSVGGAVFGMSEEVIPFVILFVPLVRALGYRKEIAVAIPLIGAGMGFAGAMINPFTVGVAQAIAGLPPLSGWPFRTGCWVVLTVLGTAWVTWQAHRSRRGGARVELSGDGSITGSQVAVLSSLVGGIGLMLWGIQSQGWYVVEIGAVFLGIGLVSGVVARISPNDIAVAFTEGARDLLSAALVVGFARGVVLLASDLRMLDTALWAASQGLVALPPVVSLSAMFGFQSLLNILVPSGSGQAALTMPIMAPLAELSGLTRQMAVLAFQFGDGFTNLITPTSAVLMGCIEVGKVSYEEWFRFSWRLQVWLALVGVGLLSLAVAVGYGG